MTHLLDFSDELLLIIAAATAERTSPKGQSALFALTRVCSRWRRIALDRTLWRGAHLSLLEALVITNVMVDVRELSVNCAVRWPCEIEEIVARGDFDVTRLVGCVTRLHWANGDDWPRRELEAIECEVIQSCGPGLHELTIAKLLRSDAILPSIATFLNLTVLRLGFHGNDYSVQWRWEFLWPILRLPRLDILDMDANDDEKLIRHAIPLGLPREQNSVSNVREMHMMVNPEREGLINGACFPRLERAPLAATSANAEVRFFGDDSRVPKELRYLHVHAHRLRFTYPKLCELVLQLIPFGGLNDDLRFFPPFEAYQVPSLQTLDFPVPVHGPSNRYPLEWMVEQFSVLPSLRTVSHNTVRLGVLPATVPAPVFLDEARTTATVALAEHNLVATFTRLDGLLGGMDMFSFKLERST